MTLASVFAGSFGIGLVVAAPVGAMAVRCIERTLAGGRVSGYATGAGIATADALYAAVAAFGLTALTAALTGAQDWVRLVGGVALIYIGTATALARSAGAAPGGRATVQTSYGSALLLTLANPQTILMFAGIFAGAGLATGSGGWPAAATTVAGVYAGSLAWWLLLVSVVAIVRDRLGGTALRWVTRSSGAAIAIFGVLTAVAGAGSLIGR